MTSVPGSWPVLWLAGVSRAADRFEQVLRAAVEPPVGWCGGAAGLVMVGSEVLAGAAAADARLAALVKRMTEVDEDEAVDLSVCHGVGGVVQTLVATARSGQESHLGIAEDYLRRVGAAVDRSGNVTGVPHRTTLPGYFLGWSGLADSALLLELEQQGRPSWIPLTFTPHLTAEEAP